MASFSGSVISLYAVAEGGVRRAGEGLALASPQEGGVRLAGEAITESFASIYPFVEGRVLTATETWSTEPVTVPANVVVPTATETWTTEPVATAVLPVVPTGGVAFATEPVAAQVEPDATTATEAWSTEPVTVPGEVTPTVPTAAETWTTGTVSVRPARPRAPVYAAGSADAFYVDILHPGEAPPDAPPTNVYVFRPKAPPRVDFVHKPAERRLMDAGIGYAPASVNLWAVLLTGVFFASALYALRKRGR